MVQLHISHFEDLYTMFPPSCTCVYGMRTQVVRWARRRKLGAHRNVGLLPKMFLHIFNTHRSKFRWVQI